jgi:cell division cycle 14
VCNVQDHVEIITDKFYFVVAQTPQAFRGAAASGLVLHVDSEALYEPFFADFGPLNAAHTFRFCIRANELLQVCSAL